jgi:hypothetical protein
LRRLDPINAVIITSRTVERPPMACPTETSTYISASVTTTNIGNNI